MMNTTRLTKDNTSSVLIWCHFCLLLFFDGSPITPHQSAVVQMWLRGRVTSLPRTAEQLPALHAVFIRMNGSGSSVLTCCRSGRGIQASPHQQMSAALEMRSEELPESRAGGRNNTCQTERWRGSAKLQQPSFTFTPDVAWKSICWELSSAADEILKCFFFFFFCENKSLLFCWEPEESKPTSGWLHCTVQFYTKWLQHRHGVCWVWLWKTGLSFTFTHKPCLKE